MSTTTSFGMVLAAAMTFTIEMMPRGGRIASEPARQWRGTE
jgi:hypothetical protein